MGVNREGVNVSTYWEDIVQLDSDGTFSTLDGDDITLSYVDLTTNQEVGGQKTFTAHPVIKVDTNSVGPCIRFQNEHENTNFGLDLTSYNGTEISSSTRTNIFRAEYLTEGSDVGWGFQFFGRPSGDTSVSPLGIISAGGAFHDFTWRGNVIQPEFIATGLDDNDIVAVDGTPASGEIATWTANGLDGKVITDFGIPSATIDGDGSTQKKVLQITGSAGSPAYTWVDETDTNTTYTAGTGISLSGTEFSADFGQLGIPSTTIDGDGTTQRKILKITGSAGSPSYEWVDDLNFNGLTAETSLQNSDTFPFYDGSATDNKKITFANLKTALAIPDAFSINGLTTATIATGDFIAFDDVSDSNNNRKVKIEDAVDVALGISSSGSSTKFLNEQGTFATVTSGSAFSINGLTAITTLADGDEVAVADASDSNNHKKITVENLKTQVVTNAAVDAALGASSSGSATKYLNEQGSFVSVSGGTLDINGLTAESGVASTDTLPFYDVSATANRKATAEQIAHGALGISSSGSATKFLNEQGTFSTTTSGSFDGDLTDDNFFKTTDDTATPDGNLDAAGYLMQGETEDGTHVGYGRIIGYVQDDDNTNYKGGMVLQASNGSSWQNAITIDQSGVDLNKAVAAKNTFTAQSTFNTQSDTNLGNTNITLNRHVPLANIEAADKIKTSSVFQNGIAINNKDGTREPWITFHNDWGIGTDDVVDDSYLSSDNENISHVISYSSSHFNDSDTGTGSATWGLQQRTYYKQDDNDFWYLQQIVGQTLDRTDGDENDDEEVIVQFDVKDKMTLPSMDNLPGTSAAPYKNLQVDNAGKVQAIDAAEFAVWNKGTIFTGTNAVTSITETVDGVENTLAVIHRHINFNGSTKNVYQVFTAGLDEYDNDIEFRLSSSANASAFLTYNYSSTTAIT